MCQSIVKPADRLYQRKCQIIAGTSFILYFACSQASLRLHNTALCFAVAALAGAALFTEFVSVGLLFTRLRDEFQRVLLIRSFIWGTIVTMGFVTMWGFTEIRTRGLVPRLDIIWVPVILVSTVTGAKLVIFRQYSADNE